MQWYSFFGKRRNGREKKRKKGILALIKIKARPRQQINAAAAAAAPTALETFSS